MGQDKHGSGPSLLPAGAAGHPGAAALHSTARAVGASAAGVWWLLAAALLAAVLVLPLLATGIPPLVDYPNHLARFAVLTAAGADPALDRLFTVHWAFYPNLATDLLVPPLARLMPLEAAGRVMVACHCGARIRPGAGLG